MAAHRELAGRGIGSVIAVTGTGPAPDGVVTGDAAWALLQSAGAIVKSPGIPHTFGEYIEQYIWSARSFIAGCCESAALPCLPLTG